MTLEAPHQVIGKPSSEGLLSRRLRQLLDAFAQLTYGDDAEVDTTIVQVINPLNDLPVRALGDKLRDDIGIEEILHKSINAIAHGRGIARQIELHTGKWRLLKEL